MTVTIALCYNCVMLRLRYVTIVSCYDCVMLRLRYVTIALCYDCVMLRLCYVTIALCYDCVILDVVVQRLLLKKSLYLEHGARGRGCMDLASTVHPDTIPVLQ